ncbi:MAG: TIGR02757 family protein [Flavisolibacter sp.]|nr:TIGR02757 family protein [Flavisolibacter sp.]
MEENKLKDFLNKKVDEYNQPSFIQSDPISVPHRFSKKQDIEIAAFFASIFAWGNRTIIINKTTQLMELMGNTPHDFIIHHKENDLKTFLNFRHRTFNTTDVLYFILFLQHHYKKHNSLEDAFFYKGLSNQEERLNYFHTYFFSLPEAPPRTKKHIAAPFRKSTCKRLNMFLRWMVRKDNCGVDFGIWKTMNPSELICPVDLHVARVARNFDLIKRKQTDWQTAVELTDQLKKFDKKDPVKYDFALFALGVVERF